MKDKNSNIPGLVIISLHENKQWITLVQHLHGGLPQHIKLIYILYSVHAILSHTLLFSTYLFVSVYAYASVSMSVYACFITGMFNHLCIVWCHFGSLIYSYICFWYYCIQYNLLCLFGLQQQACTTSKHTYAHMLSAVICCLLIVSLICV